MRVYVSDPPRASSPITRSGWNVTFTRRRRAYVERMCLKTRLRRAPALAAALIALALPGPAASQYLSDVGEVIEAHVLPGWTTQGGTRMSGLRLSMAPGWKTYWRAPGDSGIPPQFDWSGSQNLAGVTVYWPRPEVHRINGMRSIGYSGEVVLPLEIAARQPGQPVQLKARIALGVCEDICIPISLDITATLSGAGAADGAIQGALNSQPRRQSLQITCRVTPIRDGMALEARLSMPRMGVGETVVIEPSDSRIWVSEPEVTRSGNTLEARAELVPPQAKPFALDRSGLRFTVITPRDAIEVMGCSAG